MMRALQLVEPGVLAIEDVAVPAIGPRDVLLKVRGAGICHSDIHIRHLPVELFPLPLTLGHEVAGSVVSVGSEVSGWSVGDNALVHLIWACGECAACVRGDDNVCEAAGRMAQPPTPGLGPAGGMAEYMAVPARYLVALGDLDPATAAPLADAAMTPYHAIRNSSRVLRPGSTAVVIGIGGLGHVAVQLLHALNGARIVAVDVSRERLAGARSHGADLTIAADDATAAAILETTSGRGADAIFDFVGSQNTTDLSVATVAPDGIYQLVGIGGGQPRIVAEPRMGDGWPYGAAVRTSYGGTKGDLVECVALARAGRITIDVERFSLEDGIAAFDRLEAGTINGRAVLIP
jgi:propanol-preferring alcohol dehydrogenase